MTWLVVQDFSLLVEAFFMRKPEDDPAAVHAWLLARNAHMYGLAFSIDQLGDVYIVGKLPLSAVEPDEIDRLLGCMLRYSDDGFDTAVALGYENSIRREWAWRVKRGESTANLQPPFAGRFAGDEPAHTGRMAPWRPFSCSVTARASGTGATSSPAGSTSPSPSRVCGRRAAAVS